MGSEVGFSFSLIETDDHRSSHLVIMDAFMYLVIIKVSSGMSVTP